MIKREWVQRIMGAALALCLLLGVMYGAFAEGENKKIRVIFLCGQSNAVGYARLHTLDKQYQTEYPEVLLYNGGDGVVKERNTWVGVRPGQGTSNLNTACFGPELGMASVFSQEEEQYAIIKFAWGGTAIYQLGDINNNPNNHSNWHGPWDGVQPARTLSQINENTSGDLYVSFMNTARAGLSSLKKMGYEIEIGGLVWMQGEADGEDRFNTKKHQAAAAYEHNLTELFAAFRRELGEIAGQDLSEMPIVLGEIYADSQYIAEKHTIIQAQNNVVRQPNTYLVETDDLPIDPQDDGWHWYGPEAYALGRRFAEKLLLAHKGMRGVSPSQVWMDLPEIAGGMMIRQDLLLHPQWHLAPGDQVKSWQIAYQNQNVIAGEGMPETILLPADRLETGKGILHFRAETAQGFQLETMDTVQALNGAARAVKAMNLQQLSESWNAPKHCKIKTVDGGVQFRLSKEWASFPCPAVTLKASDGPYLLVDVADVSCSWGIVMQVGTQQRYLQLDTMDEGMYVYDIGQQLRNMGLKEGSVVLYPVVSCGGRSVGGSVLFKEMTVYLTAGE